MKKTMIIVGKAYKESLSRNFFVMVLVGLSVFMLGIGLAYFRNTIYLDSYSKSTGLYEKCMYAGSPGKKIFKEYIYQNEDIPSTANPYDVLTQNIDLSYEKLYRDYAVKSYPAFRLGSDKIYIPSECLKELSFSTYKGIWFDRWNYNTDYIPVVIGFQLSKKYKVGDYIDIGSSESTGKVIGILKRNSRFISPSVSGNGIDLNNATDIADDKIIIGADFESVYGNSAPHYLTRILVLPDTNREAAMEAVYEELGDIVDTFSFKKLTDDAHENNADTTRMQLILSAMTVFISIIGIACSNLIDSISKKRKLAIYFLCGMNSKTGMITISLEGIIRILMPALVGIVAFVKYCQREEYDGLYVDSVNYIIMFAVLLLIFVFTSIGPLRAIKKASPVDVLRTE